MILEQIFSPDHIYITIAILATVSLLFVSILVGVTTRRRQEQVKTHCRYRSRKRLMDGPEKRCFQLLIDLFGNRFYIIPDVALSALLNHRVGTQDKYAAYHFIEGKSVDFVLCNKKTLRPICAVKINDQRRSKDKEAEATDMAKFFRSAHLPFVYLDEPAKLTERRLIDEFSRVIYETSIIEPSPRGRRKKSK